MLLLPYRDKSALRNLPIVTLLLAAACAVCYFYFQAGDEAAETLAYDYYHDSGLDTIELPRYQAYLAARTDSASGERLHLLQAAVPGSQAGPRLLESDVRFLDALHGRTARGKEILAEDDPAYSRWTAARAHFEELLGATFRAHYALSRSRAAEAWRFVTYDFLHTGTPQLLGNLVVLLLLAPFVEAPLGHARFALAYLLGGAIAGGLHVLLSDTELVGAGGALAALVGMLAALHGARLVPAYYGTFAVLGRLPFPPIALLPIWLLVEGYQWSLKAHAPLSDASVDFAVHALALCAGAVLAWLLRPAESVQAAGAGRAAADAVRRSETGSTLEAQAQDAAARLDIKRATRLYRELAELEPNRTDYLGAYLNVALLGADEEALQDAALRLLWNKFRTPTDELRKTFLQLTQPKVLKALPIDEHLRLARRLVRFREDQAALRLIDDLLRDDHLRELYGRQLADCLLGLFTAYSRHGLQKQAEQINSRLSSYFPSADQIGGIAPAHRPPSTLLTSVRTTGGLTLARPDLRTPPATQADKPGN